ncbi:hypothetical protein SESBI_27341 [Sesbania bispinosa]|nr:hypothetical protein SESBI_27341 [Sesbania bispinosa]
MNKGRGGRGLKKGTISTRFRPNHLPATSTTPGAVVVPSSYDMFGQSQALASPSLTSMRTLSSVQEGS